MNNVISLNSMSSHAHCRRGLLCVVGQDTVGADFTVSFERNSDVGLYDSWVPGLKLYLSVNGWTDA